MFFSISLLIYLRELLDCDILETKMFINETVVNVAYSLTSTEFGKTSASNTIPILIAVIKSFITTILITLVNIGIVYEFNKRFNKRIQLKIKYKVNLSKNNVFNFLHF